MTLPIPKTDPDLGADSHSFKDETCNGPNNRLVHVRNQYSPGNQQKPESDLYKSSGMPRTDKGGIDVEEMLRRVRAGWSEIPGCPWYLPSTDIPGPGCKSKIGTAKGCGDCAHRWPIMASCRFWVCPQCAPSRVRQMAMGAAIKLEAILTTLIIDEEYRGHRVGRNAAIRRASLSPPSDRRHEMYGIFGHRIMTDLRKEARELAMAKGFLGLCEDFHPWRDTIEKWTFNVDGPHFHMTGPATWLESGGDTEPDNGWIFEVNPRWYRRAPEIYEVIAYDLTHVGVVPNKPVINWSGAAHGRNLKLDPRVIARIKAIESGSHAVCPKCDGLNTYTIVPTQEDLERWGIMKPLESTKREDPKGPQHPAIKMAMRGAGASQYHPAPVTKCDDCGHVAIDGGN